VLNKREFTSRWTGMYLRQKTLAGFSSSKNVEKTKVLHYSCSKAAFLVNSKYGKSNSQSALQKQQKF